MAVEYGCGVERIGEDDNLGLRWKVFTDNVLVVERSGHWSRRWWWFGGKKVIP